MKILNTSLACIVVAGLGFTANAQSPKMKMTTPIPESISTPD